MLCAARHPGEEPEEPTDPAQASDWGTLGNEERTKLASEYKVSRRKFERALQRYKHRQKLFAEYFLTLLVPWDLASGKVPVWGWEACQALLDTWKAGSWVQRQRWLYIKRVSEDMVILKT